MPITFKTVTYKRIYLPRKTALEHARGGHNDDGTTLVDVVNVFQVLNVLEVKCVIGRLVVDVAVHKTRVRAVNVQRLLRMNLIHRFWKRIYIYI